MHLSPGTLLDIEHQHRALNIFYRWDSLSHNAHESDLALALYIAYHIQEITLNFYHSSSLTVNTKPDMTPVSEADLAAETKIRDILTSYRPHDQLLGEEFGGQYIQSGRQWIIDPIDGTKNYIRNVPIWATLLCLMVDGEPQVAVIAAPAMKRLWWASKNHGSYTFLLDNTISKLHVSTINKLSDCSLGMSSLHHWAERTPHLLSFMDNIWRVRGYGDFYIYCLLAEGAIDIAVEPEVSLWDLAAPALIVQEAGGIFTNLAGKPGCTGGSALAANPLLHEMILNYLTPERI